MEQLKLNIGSGDKPVDGFISIDRKLGHEACPLPNTVTRWYEGGTQAEDIEITDGSVDEIRASHVLEHFGWNDALRALVEWNRVLKAGGKLRVAVPDFDKVSALPNDNPLKLKYLMGGQMDEDDIHRSAYTKETLTDALTKTGFKVTGEWESEINDCASYPISLNLEAVKMSDCKIAEPQPDNEPQAGRKTGVFQFGDKSTQVKVIAFTSIPRLGFQDHWGCVQQVFGPMGVPVYRGTGAFWGQCMQNGFNACIDNGADWIIAMDYDTLFTARDVQILAKHLNDHPEIDAITGLQPRRNSGALLATLIDKDGGAQRGDVTLSIGTEPLEIRTAHFGLTILRVSSLEKMSKPWFWSTPGEDGEWAKENGHVDDDIYFWHKWREVGNSIYLAPSVNLGHLELMVAEFHNVYKAGDGSGFEMLTRHIPVNDWIIRQGIGVQEMSR